MLETATKYAPFSRDSLVQTVDCSELFRLHWCHVYRLCLRITRNQDDAEDAAQECFMRAFSHLHTFKGNAQFTTWLTSIARNCSLMILRKRKTRREVQIANSLDSNEGSRPLDLPDAGPDQLRQLLYAETRGRLIKAVGALPVSLRKAADLVILKEQSLEEVGDILNISRSGVKARLFRARHRLIRLNKRHCLSFGLSRRSSI